MEIGSSINVTEAKIVLSEFRDKIDASSCTIPDCVSTIDWGAMPRGQGKRSGGMVKGSMSGAPRGIKKYFGIDMSKYMEDWELTVWRTMNINEKARYYKAREFGCNKIEARLYAITYG